MLTAAASGLSVCLVEPAEQRAYRKLCHELGEEKRQRVGLYHPPSNSSIITHNLKNGGQTAAWELMQPHSTYDHRRCMSDWMHREPRRWGG